MSDVRVMGEEVRDLLEECVRRMIEAGFEFESRPIQRVADRDKDMEDGLVASYDRAEARSFVGVDRRGDIGQPPEDDQV